MRQIFFSILVLLSLRTMAQPEKVYVQLSRYSGWPGDTIPLKAYVFQNKFPTSVSTILYVQLFDSKGLPLWSGEFPILHGEAIGQIAVPDSLSSDNYYVRAITRYQLNFGTRHFKPIPLSIYNRDKPQKVALKKALPDSVAALALSFDSVNWVTKKERGRLSSLVYIDTCVKHPVKLQILKFDTSATTLRSRMTLDSDQQGIYSFFPIDSARQTEELVLYKDSAVIGKQVFSFGGRTRQPMLTTDTLDLAPHGYNSWQISFPDSAIYDASIAVTDADRVSSPPTNISELGLGEAEDFTIPIHEKDDSYLSFQGKATRESGKRIKDEFSREILIAGAKDSNFLFQKIVRMDDRGLFRLDSLLVFGNFDLFFQINKQEDGSTKNVRLELSKFTPPPFDTTSIPDYWQDDTRIADTTVTKKELALHELARVKTLAAVTVKGWKSPRHELDKTYTSGAFSEPALFSFDVRTERRYKDLGSYLRANFPRFQGGFSSTDTPRDIMGHPFLFFVDEQNYTWDALSMFDWERIAYIKCFESDFIGDDDFIRWQNNMARGFSLVSVRDDGSKDGSGGLKIPVAKTPIIIAIYTRKGKDFRTMPGGLNRLAVKGFTPIQSIEQDRVTAYWNPLLSGRTLRVHFNNTESIRRFRVVVEGFSEKGRLIHYETVIGEDGPVEYTFQWHHNRQFLIRRMPAS